MSRKIFPQHNEVKKLREFNGWSQEWMAQAADISKRTYQRIEAGEGCSVETLKSIASVFEVNFKELLPIPEHISEDGIGIFEGFQASWWRLILLLLRKVLIKPLLVTFIGISVIVSSGLLAYGLHKSELVYIDAFVPMTGAEIAAMDARIDRLNKENPNRSKSLSTKKDRAVLTEAQEYRQWLVLITILAFLPWLLAVVFYFNNVTYSRDWYHLVEKPINLKCTALGRAITTKFSRSHSSTQEG